MEFTPKRKELTTCDELLGFYSVWMVIAESLPIYDAWTLSRTCKTLNSFLGKESDIFRNQPKNILAYERSKYDRHCCRCRGTPAYCHKLHPFHPHTCASCNKQVFEFRVVSASVATKEFGVRRSAVEGIRPFTLLYGEWGSYRGYLLTDVLALPESDRIKRRISKVSERRALLAQALSTLGLALREDSRLCKSYINDSASYDPKFSGLDDAGVIAFIVRRMAEMKMLHEYWDYASLREHAANAGRRWISSDEFEARIENLAIKRFGPYPTIWPWMKK